MSKIRVTRIGPNAYRIDLVSNGGEAAHKLATVTGTDAARRAAEKARWLREESGASDIVWDATGRCQR